MKSTNVIIALVAVTWLFDLARAEIEFEKIGNPSWEPADAFISAVDFPHSQEFSEQFDVDAIQFLSGALEESYFAADDELYVLFPTDTAAASETQPFRGAMAQAGGFDSDVFLASDMTNTDRIFRSLTIVPRSEDGQQNDMRSIPHDVFPIVSTWKHEFVNGDDVIAGCQLCDDAGGL